MRRSVEANRSVLLRGVVEVVVVTGELTHHLVVVQTVYQSANWTKSETPSMEISTEGNSWIPERVLSGHQCLKVGMR